MVWGGIIFYIFQEVDCTLLADKRNIMMLYRGVGVKVVVHSILEEVELRGWAQFKSFAVKSKSLSPLWCEASYPILY